MCLYLRKPRSTDTILFCDRSHANKPSTQSSTSPFTWYSSPRPINTTMSTSSTFVCWTHVASRIDATSILCTTVQISHHLGTHKQKLVYLYENNVFPNVFLECGLRRIGRYATRYSIVFDDIRGYSGLELGKISPRD